MQCPGDRHLEREGFPGIASGTVQHRSPNPDVFVLHLVELAPGRVATVVQQRASALRAPTVTVDELLERLAADGLRLSVAALRADLGA